MTAGKDGVISDIRHLGLSIQFELRKHLRRRRLFLVILLAILVPLIFYVVPYAFQIDFSDTANGFASSNLGFVIVLIIISGALFAGDAVSSEFEKKTGLLLFPTPQRRTSIFVGKYIAALIGVWVVVSLYYFITMLEMAQIYGFAEITVEFAQSFGLALLYAASATGIIYLLSSLLKRSVTSTLIGFFLLMMILPIITNVLMLVEVDPWLSVTHSSGLITDVLGVEGGFGGPGPGDQENRVTFEPDLYGGIGVMFGYAIVSIVLGIILSNRRGME